MKPSTVALALIAVVAARPAPFKLARREVPQEHSHENILISVNKSLQLENPDNIQDAVFGLLGAAAAAGGAGKIADADCLQQATADQAFTNAKAAADIQGMTDALIYRALERNTGKVGLASVPCESIKAVNPEIAALQQHQDPAGDGAIELNKQIAEELARQIGAIGGDVLLANEASTFKPGQLDDATAAGNTCDVLDDVAGCINSQNLRVDDLSENEIQAAVVDVANNATGVANNATDVNIVNGNQRAKDDAKKAKDAKEAKDAKAAKDAKDANKAKDAKDTDKAKDAKDTDKAKDAKDTDKAKDAKKAEDIKAGAAAGLDFGACADPTITFGLPSDGRKENAFEPANLAEFNHGSALNIGVISNFICGQLASSCKANAAAIDACNNGASAASGLKAAAAADTFNNALVL